MRYKPKAFPLHIPLCGSDHIRQFAGLPYPAVQSFSAVISGAKGAAEQVSDPKSITLEGLRQPPFCWASIGPSPIAPVAAFNRFTEGA